MTVQKEGCLVDVAKWDVNLPNTSNPSVLGKYLNQWNVQFENDLKAWSMTKTCLNKINLMTKDDMRITKKHENEQEMTNY